MPPQRLGATLTAHGCGLYAKNGKLFSIVRLLNRTTINSKYSNYFNVNNMPSTQERFSSALHSTRTCLASGP